MLEINTIYNIYASELMLFTEDRALADRFRGWKTTEKVTPQYSLTELGFSRFGELSFTEKERPFPKFENAWQIYFQRRYKRKYARAAGINLPKRPPPTKAQIEARRKNFAKISKTQSGSKKTTPKFSNKISTSGVLLPILMQGGVLV